MCSRLLRFKNYPYYVKTDKIFDKTTKYFFKVTTSEERSVTESTDSTAKLKRATSESEKEKKEEKKETLNEKIDRLALECSEDDEDFDVSDQSVIFLFNTRYLFIYLFFFILDDIIKFIVHSNGVSRSRSICGFEENSVTLLRQIARFDDTPLVSFIFLVRCCTRMCFCMIGKIYLAIRYRLFSRPNARRATRPATRTTTTRAATTTACPRVRSTTSLRTPSHSVKT